MRTEPAFTLLAGSRKRFAAAVPEGHHFHA
jgi:hypothetical protein